MERGLSVAIGESHGIEHRPENIQLELQQPKRVCLLLGSLKVIEGDTQTMLNISPGFTQSLAEIAKPPCTDPGLVIGPGVEPGLVNLRGKQLC